MSRERVEAVCPRIIRHEFDELPILSLGCRESTGPVQCRSEIPVGLRVQRVGNKRLANKLLGTVPIPDRSGNLTVKFPRIPMLWVQC
jgi:hypothetical protein